MLLVASILLCACGVDRHATPAPTNAGPLPATGAGPAALVHRVGAFNITTGKQARAAAAAGVRIDFTYGAPPTPRSDLGKQLEHLGISVVSGRIPELLLHYECQRLRGDTVHGPGGYCQGVSGGPTTANALIAQVKAYAQASASNRLLAGYWTLDDQPDTDFGSLRQIEVEVAAILHHYAPSRPTICGVGATITIGGGYSFNPAKLQDVSTSACDEIGMYVYSQPQRPPRVQGSSAYDWNMSSLLSTVQDALQSAGLGNLPWIGIGQAWGGVNRMDGSVVVRPSIAQMTQQAVAFCHAGASTMTWYAWTLTAFTNLRSPATDASLADGVLQGGSACGSLWNRIVQPRSQR